jgi:hypothetical protein
VLALFVSNIAEHRHRRASPQNTADPRYLTGDVCKVCGRVLVQSPPECRRQGAVVGEALTSVRLWSRRCDRRWSVIFSHDTMLQKYRMVSRLRDGVVSREVVGWVVTL